MVMRATERHGGGVVLERAFTGFSALPAPIVAGMARHWSEVVGTVSDASVREIEQEYRKLRSIHHPDRGGSHDHMAEINAPRDGALKERS